MYGLGVLEAATYSRRTTQLSGRSIASDYKGYEDIGEKNKNNANHQVSHLAKHSVADGDDIQSILDLRIYIDYTFSRRLSMRTVVQKWGNSLGIRIPSLYVKEFNLKNGNSVEITEEDGKIVIVPPRKELNDMLSRVTKENMHSPIETGSSVGIEEW